MEFVEEDSFSSVESFIRKAMAPREEEEPKEEPPVEEITVSDDDNTEPPVIREVAIVKIDPTDYNFLQRRAAGMARRPCTYFWIALITSVTLALLGLILGDFAIAVENNGWQSRGTMIADRHTQYLLAIKNRWDLWDSQDWDEFTDNVLPGIDARRRRLHANQQRQLQKEDFEDMWESAQTGAVSREQRRRELQLSDEFQTCASTFYFDTGLRRSRGYLWPVWQLQEPSSKDSLLLDDDVFLDLCNSEQNTQNFLIESDKAHTCGSGNEEQYLPPYSIILFARLTVQNGLILSCEQLTEAWSKYNIVNPTFKTQLQACALDMVQGYSPATDGPTLPPSCPPFFSATIIDTAFAAYGQLEYTSSLYFSKRLSRDRYFIYQNVDELDPGTSRIKPAYDTQREDLINYEIDNALQNDMRLASISGLITALAILVHTRSLFLTIIGLCQIMLSFPLAFAVYHFVFGLEFFPFLNFIGIFIVFALGADDIFVAVDKWKNARICLGDDATVQEVAAVALSNATTAMFLTTITTAIAFFGTAVCVVAPIYCFAVFAGLLIALDYVMCLLLIYPALCIYDNRRHGCWCYNYGGMKSRSEDGKSLIHRILSGMYMSIHKTRHILVVASFFAFIFCSIAASKFELPQSSDVRLLRSTNRFERSHKWRLNLLFDFLVKQEGSATTVIWGVTPADTGDQRNPAESSQLILDYDFNPSSEENQAYLVGFCDKLFAQEWARKSSNDFVCPINDFDGWLREQAVNGTDAVYTEYCNGATGLPMPEEDFNTCLYRWGQLFENPFLLVRNGQLQISMVRFRGRVRFDSPFDKIDKEWHLIEKWMQEEQTLAPASVNKMYFTSDDFWWYDTNRSMLRTAIVAALIAVATSAAVILISSRSLVLTLFASLTVTYVLVSVTTILVGLGWTLGL